MTEGFSNLQSGGAQSFSLNSPLSSVFKQARIVNGSAHISSDRAQQIGICLAKTVSLPRALHADDANGFPTAKDGHAQVRLSRLANTDDLQLTGKLINFFREEKRFTGFDDVTGHAHSQWHWRHRLLCIPIPIGETDHLRFGVVQGNISDVSRKDFANLLTNQPDQRI